MIAAPTQAALELCHLEKDDMQQLPPLEPISFRSFWIYTYIPVYGLDDERLAFIL